SARGRRNLRLAGPDPEELAVFVDGCDLRVGAAPLHRALDGDAAIVADGGRELHCLALPDLGILRRDLDRRHPLADDDPGRTLDVAGPGEDLRLLLAALRAQNAALVDLGHARVLHAPGQGAPLARLAVLVVGDGLDLDLLLREHLDWIGPDLDPPHRLAALELPQPRLARHLGKDGRGAGAQALDDAGLPHERHLGSAALEGGLHVLDEPPLVGVGADLALELFARDDRLVGGQDLDPLDPGV